MIRGEDECTFAAFEQVTVEKWRDNHHETCIDQVAIEVPVALEYNGISHAVMLASPTDLHDFALGFSLTEGILNDASELFDCEVSAIEDGIQIKMRIPSQLFMQLKERRRNLVGRTGCGLCGAETLQQVIRKLPALQNTAQFSMSAIHAGMKAMQAQQSLQQQTGATHAASWLCADGTLILVREDVGRHNALDKLIGALARQGEDFSSGAALITSRASVEMVQKVASAGIATLAAISAPTNLAITMAKKTGVTLLGFVRDETHVIYANGQCIEKGMPNGCE